MKLKGILSAILRAAAYTVIALILLLCGTILILYSPWAQDMALQAVTQKMNGADGGLGISASHLRLRFPLRLEADDVLLTQHGDTMMAASRARADVKILPLLRGEAAIRSLQLIDGAYRIGTPDSAMYMDIKADSIGFAPATVQLSDLSMDFPSGTIRGGSMGLYLNPDTTVVAETESEPSTMTIKVGDLVLDHFVYRMRLMPVIDTLRADISRGKIAGALVDLGRQHIGVRDFFATGLDARYIVPDSAAIAAAGPYPDEEADTVASAPWIVEVDSIDLRRSHAVYALKDAPVVPGFDVDNIVVDDLDLRLSHFYNCRSTVRLPLSLRGHERCGLDLAINGELDIDSVGLDFRNFDLSTTAGTQAHLEGYLATGDMAADPTLPVRVSLDGQFDPTDLAMALPSLKAYMAAVPAPDDIELDLELDGTTGDMAIDRLDLRLNRCINLMATGRLKNVFDPNRMAGDISLGGNIIDVRSFKNALLAPATAKTLNIPPMTLDGHVTLDRGTVDGVLKARTGRGILALDALWNSHAEGYDLTLTTARFPVQAFMPSLGVGSVSTRIDIKGQGYDPFDAHTDIDASISIPSAEYQGVTYSRISGTAALHGGMADIVLDSDNPSADLHLAASGNLDGDVYRWNATVDGQHIDLLALKMAEAPSSIETTLSIDAQVGPSANDLTAHLVVNDLFLSQESGTISISDVDLHLNCSDSLTALQLTNRDMTGHFDSPMALNALIDRFGSASELLAASLSRYTVQIDSLHKALPPFALDLRGGYSNLVNDILAPSKMSVRSFALSVDNDSLLGLNGRVNRFATGSMILDTITIAGRQEGRDMNMALALGNRHGNMDEWHRVDIAALINDSTATLGLHQQNIKGRTGFELGARARAFSQDSTIRVTITPFDPIIGYQNWTVNPDNFISYNLANGHIDANLHMQGGNSSLAIFTEHPSEPDSISHGHEQEDLILKLNDIHISDWIAFNPFAPPIRGDVTADMRLNRDHDILVGSGSAGITNFSYDRQRVADIKVDFNVAASAAGNINADADLFVDGARTMTLHGALNDSTRTSPLDLDFAMIHFPLTTANPFLGSSIGTLSGTLNGKMKISGTDARPILNGYLDFDSTAMRLAMTATQYSFSSNPIEVVESQVQLKDFAITGCNDNPLLINGNVDISDLSAVKFNVGLKANNMMIVNSSRATRGADIFGKGYITLDARAHGSTQLMWVNANVRLLSGTNVTYVIPDATNMISNRSTSDMVHFVNFTDSIAVAQADSIRQDGMALFLDSELVIEDGTTINVDLSPDGSDRVQLQSNGNLSFDMTPLNNGRLVGRLNIEQGFVRYTPPLMSEKLFKFDPGSYIAFTGDMMNPTLNIHAKDVIKANVTQEGQNSRLIYFDVLLSATGTLNHMNVAFDLATNDDMTVANELESMTAEQRANQAMNMLIYNVYTGPNTKASSSLSGNPLFSFLESQLNSWMASNIRGVDLSVGINQYDRTVGGTTSTTTSYSYQVSKSLFNDRFKIVVGGNYSTDAKADENFQQNLINDISFEYYLNKQRSMYLRLFRHTGYESILEGEITQTGVGFVYRRKLRRLVDMFLPASVVRRREQKQAEKYEKKDVEPIVKEAVK